MGFTNGLSKREHQGAIARRWMLSYAALTALSLIVVTSSMFLTGAFSSKLSQSVSDNLRWGERTANISRLTSLASDMQELGLQLNHQAEAGSILQKRAHRIDAFRAISSNTRAEIQSSSPSDLHRPLLTELELIDRTLERIEEIDHNILYSVKAGDSINAAAYRAEIIDAHHALSGGLHESELLVRSIQNGNFQLQSERAALLGSAEFAIAGLACVMAIALTLFGYQLSRHLSRAELLTRQAQERAESSSLAAEEALREVSTLRVVLDQHTLLSITDRHGRIIDANEGFCRISGYDKDELIGQDHRMLNSGVHPKSFWVSMWKTIASGQAWRQEVCNRAKDGSLYWVDSTNVPWLDENGNVEKYVSLRFDVTAKKLAEAAVTAARRTAENANRAKSDFLANMSHEIRTPMTAILGFTELLSEDFAADPKGATEAIRIIRSNANHLLTVINDVLDVSKIESGQMSVEVMDTQPAQIAADVAQLVAPRAKGKGVEVTAICDTPMPDRIQSDPTRLRQILLNLIGNAIKFTDTGSVTIRMACDIDAQLMRFRVEDTGIGMTQEQISRISQFNAFVQADESMSRKYGGTGLGLRISNSLAQMLGGGLEVESALGHGSAFTATIKTGELAGVRMRSPDEVFTAPTTTSTQPKQQNQTERRLEGIRVLLAEDGPDNQRLISHHLRKAGATVTICENGRIAVETLRDASESDRPHVVLMDMQMPELDGYGATRMLRESGYTIPILALTAHVMDGDRRKCLDAGCDAYLTKPIDRDAIIEACQVWAAADAPDRSQAA